MAPSWIITLSWGKELCNSMKLWVMLCRAIQDRWVTVKAMAFSSSHVWIWQLDYKAGWTLNNWCFWIVVLEKTLESSLGCKDNKPINLRGNQSWIFIRRTDAEAPILWPPYAKSHLIGKDTNAGKDWKQKKKKETEWDGWMASMTQWTWVWANSGR